MAKLMQKMATTSQGKPGRLGLTLIRLMVGVVFIMHGTQKVLNMNAVSANPTFHAQVSTLAAFEYMDFGKNSNVAAYAATAAELGCGLLLVLGLLTRLATIPIITTMAVAVTKVHLDNGFFAPRGYEYPLTLGLCALGLLFAGPGMLAVDNFFGGKK